MTSTQATQYINEPPSIASSEEANEMLDYFQNVCMGMDDIFSLEKYDIDQTNDTRCIYFDKFPRFSKDYVKFYVYSVLHDNLGSPQTIHSQSFHLKKFIDFLTDEFHTIDIALIEDFEYKAYIDNLIKAVEDKDLQIKTAYSYIVTVRDFLNCLESNNLASYDYITRYDIPKIFPINKPTVYYTREEEKKYKEEQKEKRREKPISYPDLVKILSFIDQCKNTYARTAIIILSHTGLRLKELLNLKIDCIEKEYSAEKVMHFDSIQKDEGIYWLSRYKVSKTKHKHWKDGTPILVPKAVYDAINELIEYTSDFRNESGGELSKALFLNKRRSGSIYPYGIFTGSSIRNKMRDYAEDIGIKHFMPHQFRYTFAKLLYDKQIPLDYIKKYLNHISEDMSAHYISKNKSKSVSKYKDFARMGIIEGHAKENAVNYQKRIKKVFTNEVFQGMAAEKQIELLDMISLDMDMGINIMDHGLCFLPKNTPCPNNFTEVNSCIDSHCSKFGTTDKSIPFLKSMIEYKELSILELVKKGFSASAEYNQKKLNKTVDIYNKLKERQSE